MNFDSNTSNFGPVQNTERDFKPVHVIDYQNRKLSDQKSLFRIQRPQTDDQRSKPFNQFDENFPRRVYEYGHKSKKVQFKWFSPVQYFEYNHQSKGISLHEEPPPKPLEPKPIEQKYMPNLRPGYVPPTPRYNSPWPARPPFRQERPFSTYPRNEAPYHPRPEFYPAPSSYRPRADFYPPSYSGYPPHEEYPAPGPYPPRAEAPNFYYRNPYDKGNLIHNSRIPPPNLRYGQESRPPLKIEPSTSAGRKEVPKPIKEVHEMPKLDIRSLLLDPGRQTRPKK